MLFYACMFGCAAVLDTLGTGCSLLMLLLALKMLVCSCNLPAPRAQRCCQLRAHFRAQLCLPLSRLRLLRGRPLRSDTPPAQCPLQSQSLGSVAPFCSGGTWPAVGASLAAAPARLFFS